MTISAYEKTKGELAVASLTARTHSLWLLKGFDTETAEIVRGLCRSLKESHDPETAALAERQLTEDMGTLSSLQTGWTVVFGSGHTSITPQQSVLEEGLSMGKARDAARAFMLRFGAEPVRTGEPEDHIGIQVEFLAVLIERFLLDGDPTNLIQARDFCAEHLAWISQLREITPVLFPENQRESSTEAVLDLLELTIRFVETLPSILDNAIALFPSEVRDAEDEHVPHLKAA